jgi:hypothetical protein
MVLRQNKDSANWETLQFPAEKHLGVANFETPTFESDCFAGTVEVFGSGSYPVPEIFAAVAGSAIVSRLNVNSRSVNWETPEKDLDAANFGSPTFEPESRSLAVAVSVHGGDS